MYYLCSENKGADQLCGYHTADLLLCFHICKKLVSHDAAHMCMDTTGTFITQLNKYEQLKCVKESLFCNKIIFLLSNNNALNDITELKGFKVNTVEN